MYISCCSQRIHARNAAKLVVVFRQLDMLCEEERKNHIILLIYQPNKNKTFFAKINGQRTLAKVSWIVGKDLQD
jgi:hypothetical protein